MTHALDLIHFKHAFETVIQNKTAEHPRLKEAMAYTLFQGKMLRPQLVFACGSDCNIKSDTLYPIAMAIECIHASSLILDDLPAMDNDDFRRGQPSCHKKFDEATALLAADGLICLAHRILADPTPSLTADTQLALIRCLEHHSGISGLLEGQMLDILGSDTTPIESIHKKKTALLFRCCTKMIEHCLPSEATTLQLADLGETIGMLYQLIDDIQDLIEEKDIGPAHYLRHYTREAADLKIKELIHTCFKQIGQLPEQGKQTAALINQILKHFNLGHSTNKTQSTTS